MKPSSDIAPNPHLNRDIKAVAGEVYRLGMTLCQAGAYRQAAFQFRKLLIMDPDFSDAALALGHCLHMLGNHEEALTIYDQLLTASPHSEVVCNNRGTTLLEMGRYEEAAASFSHALELMPNLHDARIALATCCQALGRVSEAMTACDTVLMTAPEHSEAHWNRSLLLLLKGNYREGWREYEWRWRKRNFTSPLRDFPQPLWRGEAPAGRTILIHAEQGFGDTLQFCRYVPLVADRSARVAFECHPPLLELMKSLTGNVHVIPMGQPLPDFDLHVPLMSLPLLFDTTIDNIPATVPYLNPPVTRLPFWRGQITDNGCLKVGLCWAGKGYPDPRRSCPVELLTLLANVGGVSWFSLQPGWKASLPFSMIDLTGHLHDFADTATLISHLDLIITIDTAVAHLAGALGKPTWVMLTHAPDWRWMLDREDSPWYPSMRLFRHVKPGSWEDVIQRIGHSLKDVVTHQSW